MMLNNSVVTSAKGNLQAWIPPNDRELIIRAKLKTGWSSRCSFNSNSSHSASGSSAPVITDNELNEIEEVIKRAGQIEKKERNRISRLIDRFKTINKPLGDGLTHCFICNSNFGLLTHSNSHTCGHCLKNVCSTCSFETACLSKNGMVMLCKICVEYRDFLKKSGLWFNKNLLCTELPTVLEANDAEKSSPSSLQSEESNLDIKKNSIFTSESKYTDLESDTDSLKLKPAKSVHEVNGPEQESKLLLEEVALSKQTALNLTSQVSQLGQPGLQGDSQKFLFKTSTLANGESTQNISLAFKQFMETETSRFGSSSIQCGVHRVTASA